MAKIARATQKLFGSTGATSDFGQFGSLAAGSPVTSKNPTTIQALTQFLAGWKAAVLTVGGQPQVPALEDLNALFLLAFQQIGYILQEGMSEWDAGTTYYTNSFVQVNGVIYKSLIDTNLNLNPTTNPLSWTLAIIPPDSPFISGEIRMWGGSIAAISGLVGPWIWCNGQTLLRASYPTLFAAIGTKWGSTDSTNFLVPQSKDLIPVGASADFSGVSKTVIEGSAQIYSTNSQGLLQPPQTSVKNRDSQSDGGSGPGETDTHAHTFVPPYFAPVFMIKT